MKIIGTGLSGLVGSRVVKLLSPEFSFENLSLETGVDITDQNIIEKRLVASAAPWVFHFAAYTNVQGAETDHDTAWKINVTATENIAKMCENLHKKLLYIDTDYAFDGKKETYSEDDTPHPLGWYAKTKTEGAKRVLAVGGLVIRISNPYRANPVGKKDWVHKMIDRFQSGQAIICAEDQSFVPTFIDDIAPAIRVLVRLGASGIYHVVSAPALSPYDAGRLIADTFGTDTSLVHKTTFAEMFLKRAPIPQYAALSNAKICALGITMNSFKEGIAEVKKQES